MRASTGRLRAVGDAVLDRERVGVDSNVLSPVVGGDRGLGIVVRDRLDRLVGKIEGQIDLREPPFVIGRVHLGRHECPEATKRGALLAHHAREGFGTGRAVERVRRRDPSDAIVGPATYGVCPARQLATGQGFGPLRTRAADQRHRRAQDAEDHDSPGAGARSSRGGPVLWNARTVSCPIAPTLAVVTPGSERVASALWWISAEVVLTLDAQLGVPVDSYLNGSQTWLIDSGPVTLEWRLHPVGGFELPAELSHYDLWEQVVASLSSGSAPDHLVVGADTRSLRALWDGLECFVAFSDDVRDVEPANLARIATERLGLAPDLCGIVDHGRIADEWLRSGRGTSIVRMLADELAG